MFLSSKYKFVFIHVPKAAGTSIVDALHKGSGENLFRATVGGTRHLTISEFNEYMKKMRCTWFKLDDYYKFAFVRNPWERIVSLFFYIKQNEDANKDRYAKKYKKIDDFREFIDIVDISKPLNAHKHGFRNQIEYLCNKKGDIIMDFVGRYENLKEDIKFVKTHLNLDYLNLEKLNAAKYNNYKEYYDEALKSKVAKIFAKDIQHFNYQFE